MKNMKTPKHIKVRALSEEVYHTIIIILTTDLKIQHNSSRLGDESCGTKQVLNDKAVWTTVKRVRRKKIRSPEFLPTLVL